MFVLEAIYLGISDMHWVVYVFMMVSVIRVWYNAMCDFFFFVLICFVFVLTTMIFVPGCVNECRFLKSIINTNFFILRCVWRWCSCMPGDMDLGIRLPCNGCLSMCLPIRAVKPPRYTSLCVPVQPSDGSVLACPPICPSIFRIYWSCNWPVFPHTHCIVCVAM